MNIKCFCLMSDTTLLILSLGHSCMSMFAGEHFGFHLYIINIIYSTLVTFRTHTKLDFHIFLCSVGQLKSTKYN